MKKLQLEAHDKCPIDRILNWKFRFVIGNVSQIRIFARLGSTDGAVDGPQLCYICQEFAVGPSLTAEKKKTDFFRKPAE